MSDLEPLAVLAHELRSPVAALVAIAEAYPAADEARKTRLLELASAAVASIARMTAASRPAHDGPPAASSSDAPADARCISLQAPGTG